jgi:hypothetical protein
MITLETFSRESKLLFSYILRNSNVLPPILQGYSKHSKIKSDRIYINKKFMFEI